MMMTPAERMALLYCIAEANGAEVDYEERTITYPQPKEMSDG